MVMRSSFDQVHFHVNQTPLCMAGFARGLVLELRLEVTQKCSIRTDFFAYKQLKCRPDGCKG